MPYECIVLVCGSSAAVVTKAYISMITFFGWIAAVGVTQSSRK